MALIECSECGKQISDASEICIHCGFPLHQAKKRDSEEITQPRKRTLKPLTKKTRNTIIISIVAVLLLGVTGLTIGLVSKKNQEEQRADTYTALKYEMKNFSTSSSLKIGNYLNKLPEDYSDTWKIRNDFQRVEHYSNIISNADIILRTSKSEAARTAYIELNNMQNQNFKWNFTKFFEQSMRALFFGGNWESNTYYFYWYDNNDSLLLKTNFSSNREATKEYVWRSTKYPNYILFEYENVNDKDEKFESYKIYDFSITTSASFKVKLYNYSNNTTYTLTLN